jgi:hypothetical protein
MFDQFQKYSPSRGATPWLRSMHEYIMQQFLELAIIILDAP